uniref:Uncharacterized protein n=1 Tax=Oryza brachyantha TaxID=4533 RepID=J3MQF5_ORYBR
MRKEELDYVLVPLGLALMVAYHAWLLHRIRRRPATTVVGANAINRRIWVRHIMELAVVDYVTATLNRGSYFWSLGARAFYFSCPVFLWIFGPIPMLSACAAMVGALYFLDVCDDWWKEDDDEQSESDDRLEEVKV